MRILVTSSSFKSHDGEHIRLLEDNYKDIDFVSGPLSCEQLLDLFEADYDAIISGDDDYSSTFFSSHKISCLKCIVKYGSGLDSFDLESAKLKGVSVYNSVGVNARSVAEHAVALLFYSTKNLLELSNNNWNRTINTEVFGKKIGVVGLGNIGLNTATLLTALGADISYYDPFVSSTKYENAESLEVLLDKNKYIFIHTPLSQDTQYMMTRESLLDSYSGQIVFNLSRAEIFEKEILKSLLVSSRIASYYTDVFWNERMPQDDSDVAGLPNFHFTSHVASRTKENIEQQGLAAVQNLINHFSK